MASEHERRTDDQQRPRSSLAVWTVVAILLPVAYVLAIGPVIWIRVLVHHELEF